MLGVAVLGAAVGLAFVGEPPIGVALSRGGIWGGELMHYRWLWSAEILAGLTAVATAPMRVRLRRRTI